MGAISLPLNISIICSFEGELYFPDHGFLLDNRVLSKVILESEVIRISPQLSKT